MKKFTSLILLFLVNIAFASRSQFYLKEISPLFENTDSYVASLLSEIYSNKKDNFSCSPISLIFPLAAIANGANGLTKQNLLSFLSVNSEKELNELSKNLISSLQNSNKEPNVLTVANGIFSKNEPKQTFLKKVESLSVFVDKLKSSDQINDWVSSKTNGLIKKIIEELSQDDKVFIINAIYFKGEWKYKFENENTYTDLFFINENSISEVKYMKANVNDAEYYHSEEVSILKYDYVNSDFYVLFILPSEKISIDEYIKTLSYSKLKEYRLKMTKTKLNIHIPKFKVESTIDFKEILEKLGLSRMFSNYNEFLGITNDKDLYVDNVVQVTTITVDESGTEAAAATAIGFKIESASLFEAEDFRLNRPFVFSINHIDFDIPIFISIPMLNVN